MMSEDGRSARDVIARIGMAKTVFREKRELLTRRCSKSIRKRMAKTLVWPVAIYGCETWTLRKDEIDRLNAFEMWL